MASIFYFYVVGWTLSAACAAALGYMMYDNKRKDNK